MQVESGAAVRLDVVYDSRINLAMQQNAIPVIKQVSLANLSGREWADLRVRVRVEPELIPSVETRVARLAPEAIVTLPGEKLDLEFPSELLARQLETESVQLILEVFSEEELVSSLALPARLLPYTHWAGFLSPPELLSAFALPNHSALTPFLHEAGELLREWTGHSGLDGYQSADRNRVRLMAAALFAAVKSRKWVYQASSPSFEESGQKVNTPDQIVTYGLANCLDLSMLFVSLLERMGLNPVVCITPGHAFPGVWLSEENFQETVVDDPVRLRKRVQVGDLCFFESTAACDSADLSFEQAEAAASALLAKDEQTVCLVDHRSARNQRIRPLPSRGELATPGNASMAACADCGSINSKEATYCNACGLQLWTSLAAKTEAPRASAAAAYGDAVITQRKVLEPKQQRLERWKGRLLDLSLRNRLLNVREGKAVIPLLVSDAAGFEDRLAGKGMFELLPRPELMGRNDWRSPELYEKRAGGEALVEYLEASLKSRRLHTPLTAEALPKALLALYRESKRLTEETGANMLYVGVGFLRWYESPSSTEPRYAPILLLPVELKRGSLREPFRIKLADDEPRINVTLLQKLRADYGMNVDGLDELPEDEAGYDVARILRSYQRLVVDMPRWEVEEQVQLGLFSFTKFLMWKDLSDQPAMLDASPTVSQLLDGTGLNTHMQLDRQEFSSRKARELCLPLDADSSQMLAVFAAEKGSSFVLEGPPGTGKSQTITNLIAQLLSSGKTVLFVSEKLAALEVVHRRLEAVGLGPFCLELHSNKANRQEVVKQFERALQQGRQNPPDRWERICQELDEKRRRLDDTTRALHLKRALGLSLYQALEELVADKGDASVRLPGAESWSEAEFEERLEVGQELFSAAARLGNVEQHPFQAQHFGPWTRELQAELKERWETLQGRLAAFLRVQSDAQNVAGLPAASDPASMQALSELIPYLLRTPGSTAALLDDPELRTRAAALKPMFPVLAQRQQLWRELAARIRPSLLEEQLEPLRTQAAEIAAKPGWLRWMYGSALKKTLARHWVGSGPGWPEVVDLLERSQQIQALDGKLAAFQTAGPGLFGSAFDGLESDIARLEALLDWALGWRAVRGAVEDLANAELRQWLGSVREWILNSEEQLAPGRKLAQVLNAYASAWSELRLVLPPECGNLATAHEQLGRQLEALNDLREWCRFAEGRRRLEGLQVGELWQQLRELPADQARTHWRPALLRTWAEATIQSDGLLNQFQASEHTRVAERFRGLDRELVQLSKDQATAQLSSRLPPPGDASSASELGFLQRETRKRTRHTPIRKLLQLTTNLLPRLKPCVLMSPLSVAQFLDAKLPQFDVVVFDEASQIPVWDGIGALARGRQAVIVGDSKQMPPTSFFSKGEGAGEDDAEELESILDECVAASFPNLRLRWHYRSRDERLIEFSNQNYYEGDLVTFPHAHFGEGNRSLRWVHVENGFYDRGATRTNRAEAEALVEELLRRMSDPTQAKLSFGVITFSQAQQTLVLDLWEKALLARPDLEKKYLAEAVEPMFIKNLENVQGDERDVILFSVGYGPDPRGVVSLNFGPLNRLGGERRLNVAVTRARQEMMLFSTLRPEHIDLSRVSAFGVAHLRAFLEFAAHGRLVGQSAPPEPSPLAHSVAEFLRSAGWTVHEGCGGPSSRIDLGVVHPQEPDRYLLAVDLDGPLYRDAATSRDRDRLRPGMLERMGWTHHRVPALAWWSDRAETERELLAALDAALNKVEGPFPSEELPPEPSMETVVAPPPSVEPDPVGEPMRLKEVVVLGSDSDFEQPANRPQIDAVMLEILQIEAPVPLAEAARRLAAHWGMARAGKRIVEQTSASAVRVGGRLVGDFLWAPGQDPASYSIFRVPGAGQPRRDPSSVAPEEIANAAELALSRSYSIHRAELARDTLRIFGGSAMTRKSLDAIEPGIDCLLARGGAVLEDEVVRVPRAEELAEQATARRQVESALTSLATRCAELTRLAATSHAVTDVGHLVSAEGRREAEALDQRDRTVDAIFRRWTRHAESLTRTDSRLLLPVAGMLSAEPMVGLVRCAGRPAVAITLGGTQLLTAWCYLFAGANPATLLARASALWDQPTLPSRVEDAAATWAERFLLARELLAARLALSSGPRRLKNGLELETLTPPPLSEEHLDQDAWAALVRLAAAESTDLAPVLPTVFSGLCCRLHLNGADYATGMARLRAFGECVRSPELGNRAEQLWSLVFQS